MPLPVRRCGNTRESGSAFSNSDVNAVWAKGVIDPRYDPAVYRKDAYDDWMKRDSYGTLGQYGWEIDHIRPVAARGSDALSNLQPLHWQNNRKKGDSF